MSVDRQRKPRIIIYGAGQFGQYIVRFADQKGWTIVGAYNRAGPKVGQDIGRLAGLDHDLGVVVQDAETADFKTVDADIAVVTTGNNFLSYNLPSYRRLLGAGLNVICHSVEAYFPQGNDPVIAEEIDKIAKENGVTFSGSGIWDSTRIWPGIIVTGQFTEIRSVFHKSITDCARVGKPTAVETGVGLSVDAFHDLYRGRNAGNTRVFKTVPEQVLWALGYTISETEVRVEPVLFNEPYDCPVMGRVIEPGQSAGSRVIAEIHTEEGVTARAEIEARLFWPGEVENVTWAIDGRPVTRLRVEREDNGHATSACLFNRIPDVIAAPPGLVVCSQLGPMKHSSPHHRSKVI